MFRKLRIIFAGTAKFAAIHLNALLSSDHNVIGVFTQSDKPAGRGKKLTSSLVKLLAKRKGIPIFQPDSLNLQENQQLIANLNADIMVVVEYSLILPKSVLNIPRLGCINVHSSLLPRWRGAAPIQRALWAGDNETGISIIQMDSGLDTGAILYKIACQIKPTDTSATLYNKLAYLGQDGMMKVIHQLSVGTAILAEEQNKNLVTYAKKLSKEEARIDWSLPAIQIERCIRAFNPWPNSWILIAGQPVKIWKASVIQTKLDVEPGSLIKTSRNGIQVATVDGILNLEVLQPAGRKIMSAQDLLNSNYKWFTPGTRFD